MKGLLILLILSVILIPTVGYGAIDEGTVFEIRTTGTMNNGGGFVWVSLVNSTYKWTAGGGGTAEYYCELAGGGDPSLTEPTSCTTDGTFRLDTNGSVDSLNAGEWDWADSDTLGYSTVYVRLDDDADPDTKATDFVYIGKGGGTDYSQQATAQTSWVSGGGDQTNDLATDAAGTALSSVAGGFTAVMIGNIIHITVGTGFTPGWYEITVYTDANNVTIDRSAGANATVGTGYLGGAAALGSNRDDEFFEQLSHDNLVYIKSGTHTLTENVAVTDDAIQDKPFVIEGYGSLRGDAPTGTDRPLIAAGSRDWTFDNYWTHNHIRCTTTDSNGWRSDTQGVWTNCAVSGTTRGFTGSSSGALVGCDATAPSAFGLCASAIGNIHYSYIHDGGGDGASTVTNVVGSIFDTIADDGISSVGNYGIISNTVFFGCVGEAINTLGQSVHIYNNIFRSNGTAIQNGARTIFIDHNTYSNNTIDTVGVKKGPHAVNADPLFADEDGGDFTLLTGSPCLDTGIQVGVNQGATGDYKWNIGADQDDVAAAAGGGGVGFFMVD